MKRTPLKRSRPKARVSLLTFWQAVTKDGTKPCALAGLGGCTGPLDAHHHIQAQTIRSVYATRIYKAGTAEEAGRLGGEMERALLSPANGTSVCRFHHDGITNGRVVCPRPEGLDEFLADFQLHEREAAA